MPHKLAAGNWKMNGLMADLAELDAIAATAQETGTPTLICPPATALMAAKRNGLLTGGQTCHTTTSGAHTGDISATMIADAGASHVIVGHSERRTDHKETSAHVAAQARAAWDAGLIAIICVGETLAQREANQTLEIVAQQVSESLPEGATASNTVIAYEPVWAIGTGLVPTMAQINEVHDALRDQLAHLSGEGVNMTLLYGGSVKASNAAEIFGAVNVNGALVGGASLKADDFCPIIKALTDA